MRRRASVLVGVVVIALVLLCVHAYSTYRNADLVQRVATRFPVTGFVDARDSDHFIISATVYLLEPGYTIRPGEEPDSSIQHLVYSIRAENKTSQVLQGVLMDVKLSYLVIPYITSHFPYFSSMDPVDILPGKALCNSRVTQIPNVSTCGEPERQSLMQAITGPIQVVLRWQGGEERLLVTSDQIRLSTKASSETGGP